MLNNKASEHVDFYSPYPVSTYVTFSPSPEI